MWVGTSMDSNPKWGLYGNSSVAPVSGSKTPGGATYSRVAFSEQAIEPPGTAVQIQTCARGDGGKSSFLASLEYSDTSLPMSCRKNKRGRSTIPGDIDEERWRSDVAGGKAIAILREKAKGYCAVEGGSVYGVAVAMPQFARSVGWAMSYTGLAISAYVFLFANILLQGFLLYMISKSLRIVSKFGGQMHLCDFAAQMAGCPDAPNCLGPGGTLFTPARLYNWETWAIRSFATDAVQALFAEQVDSIRNKMDPGEYGMEAFYLRAICCFLFLLGCWPDMVGSLNMLSLLAHVPNKHESWMVYEIPTFHHDKEHAKAIHGWTELDLVKFKVAGMPKRWKLINLVCVWIPKVYLWVLTVDIGMIFLMETAVIEDLIVNAVALAFILHIDEVICSVLMSPLATYMVERLEPYPLFEISVEDMYTEHEAFEKFQADKQFSVFSPRLWAAAFPVRLFAVAITCVFFMAKYYMEHCQLASDSSWVSKPIVLPLGDWLPVLSFLFGPVPGLFPVKVEASPVWEMQSGNKTLNSRP